MKILMITTDIGFFVSAKEFELIEKRVEIALFVINNSVYIPLYTYN